MLLVASAAAYRMAKEEVPEVASDIVAPTPTLAPAPAPKPKAVGGIPAEVREKIRAKAEAEWPDDYQMQRYEIRNQVKAYLDLQK